MGLVHWSRCFFSGDHRHVQGSFDLDMTYLLLCDQLRSPLIQLDKRIIAMAWPGSCLFFWRNARSDVKNFLDKYHDGKYRVYNLCLEKVRRYCSSELAARNDSKGVRWIPIWDHHPPSLVQALRFVADAVGWLTKDIKNVMAVHCLAGKGRTGTMIICLLLATNPDFHVDQAIHFYSMQRKKRKSIINPCQTTFLRTFFSVLQHLRQADYEMFQPHMIPQILTQCAKQIKESSRSFKIEQIRLKGVERCDDYESIRVVNAYALNLDRKNITYVPAFIDGQIAYVPKSKPLECMDDFAVTLKLKCGATVRACFSQHESGIFHGDGTCTYSRSHTEIDVWPRKYSSKLSDMGLKDIAVTVSFGEAHNSKSKVGC